MYGPKEPIYLRRKKEAAEKSLHTNFERKTWRLNVANVIAVSGAVIVAAAGIIVTKWLTDKQIAANKIASDQQIQVLKEQTVYAERAWVDAQVIAVDGPLQYNVNGANFTISLILKNVGHAPATSVFPTAFAYTPLARALGSSTTTGEQYLQQLKTQHCPLPTGNSLLPEGSYKSGLTFTINHDDIDLVRSHRGQGPVFLNPQALIVIVYCTGFDDVVHTTTYPIQIIRVLNDAQKQAELKKSRGDKAFFVDEGDVPANEMQVQLRLIGESSAT